MAIEVNIADARANIMTQSRSSVRRKPQPRKKAITNEPWPPIAQLTRQRQTAEQTTLRRLGLEQKKISGSNFRTSQVLEILGPDSFVEVKTVRTPGRVVWCNFELARLLGFKVPASNQMSPELQEQLLATLSLRAIAATEDVSDKEVVTLYADKYGGDGVRPALGAGRAGFLKHGNIYIKGIGFTPLFKHNDPTDFAHSHGAVHLLDCVTETVFGEVNINLFTKGSSRVLAIIDAGKDVVFPSGYRAAVGLVVRTGSQLRPGHLLGSRVRKGSLLDKFVRMTRATGQLVTSRDKKTGAAVPDAKATMLRVIDDHARTAAETYRWRMIHGALSSSNMEMSGAMLDVPTQSAQPRTAAIKALDYADSDFGTEHVERARKLMIVYRAVIRNTPEAKRDLFNVAPVDFQAEMKKSYRRHLEAQLISATGLKLAVAARLQSERPELASEFTDHLLEMTALKNTGTTLTWKSVVESVSILDVFNLLGTFPQAYFAAPAADHTAEMLDYLKPVYKGNRFQVARKQAGVDLLVKKFAELYRQLMEAIETYAPFYYGDLKSMQASIIARASFENEPLADLYAKPLHAETKKTIASYRALGEPEILRQAIDQRIAASLRSVAGLLGQGNSRRLAEGGIEMEMRTIAGINYSVRAWNDEPQTRQLHVSIPVEFKSGAYFTSVKGLTRLSKRQIQSLRYRFTTDGGKSFRESKARLSEDANGGAIIEFDDLGAVPIVGPLAGAFFLGRKGPSNPTPNFSGYVFAIPDKHELKSMLAE